MEDGSERGGFFLTLLSVFRYRKTNMMDISEFVLIGLAAVMGGAVNALAGGGTLITFPTLTAVGVPAVGANITNTVALCPGYLGGTFAQLDDLRGRRRIWPLAVVSLAGGVAGGILLLLTAEETFRRLVPYLILFASLLLAAQDRVRAWLSQRHGETGEMENEAFSIIAVGIAAVYGGYFGAGLGVITMAVLGLALHDTMTRLNAIKQFIALFANIAAAAFFLFSGKVVWPAALVMMVGALAGGSLGGRIAGRINPGVLRRIVVAVGLIIAGIYFVR
jgi:hypothetical protein